MIAESHERVERRRRMKVFLAEVLGDGEHSIRVHDGPATRVYVDGLSHLDGECHAEVTVADTYDIGLEDVCWAVERQFGVVGKYELPDMTPEEKDSLKSSIARWGVLQNVVVDEFANVIAGRGRQEVCSELGIECPTITVSGLTNPQKVQLGFELDLCRKHVTTSDKKKIARLLLKHSPSMSDRQVGTKTGLDHKTVAAERRAMVDAGQILQVQVREGNDGKRYRFPSVVSDTAKETARAAEALKQLGSDAPAKPLKLKRAERLVSMKLSKEQRIKRHLPAPLPNDSIRLVHSDFRDLVIDDYTVPMIFTDPPYDRASLPLWLDLADFAARKLRPGGLLVTYCGPMFLPEIYAALSARLTFHWQHIILHEGGSRLMYERRVGTRYKPVLVFSQGEVADLPVLNDVYQGVGAEKEFHPWQQPIEEAIHFIGGYTQPGELVVDPFGGGFTTAAACYRLGRRCLSCDVDDGLVQQGLHRLGQEAVPVR